MEINYWWSFRIKITIKRLEFPNIALNGFSMMECINRIFSEKLFLCFNHKNSFASKIFRNIVNTIQGEAITEHLFKQRKQHKLKSFLSLDNIER